MIKFAIPVIILFLVVLFWEKINSYIYQKTNMKINYIVFVILLIILSIIFTLLYF